MGRLDGRVAIVTGAGRGLGRQHALRLAGEGAAVVVNDLGSDVHGEGASLSPARQVVAEIEAAGGRAVVSGHDVSDWEQASDLVAQAVRAFGDLHVLVNNAGILRDRTLANMSERDWDAVVAVHLKGHAAPTRHACAYWRDQAQAGHEVKASVIHTTSASGFIGNFGQANYAAAKMGVIGLSKVVAVEMGRYGVRSNVVGPVALTRMGQAGTEEDLAPELRERYDPANVSPLVAWLAAADCPANNQVFHVYGDRIVVLEMPRVAADLRRGRRWTLDDLDLDLPGRLTSTPGIEFFVQ